LKQFGIHVALFEHAIKNFGETNNELKKQVSTMVQRLFVDVEQVSDQFTNVFERPFKAISFNINNEKYEQYEQKEVIYSDVLPNLNKMLRQWKNNCAPDFF
jgi:putative lipoic acid-binding regulatory protein